MRLLDWSKNLKCIHAIRRFDYYQTLYHNAVKYSIKLSNENEQLKEQIRQMQLVYHAHRSAAAQSIYEAGEAKKDYEQKALNAENSRRSPQ